jgi:glutaredoxin
MSKVTVFSTTTCKYCKQVKDYLAANNVAYEEVLLDQQPERIAESVEISGQRGVPVTKIVKDDGSAVAVLGWDQPALAAQLGLSSAAATA